MRKVIGALFLAFVAVGACVLGLLYVENTSATALSYLSEIQNQIETNDYKNSKANAENLEKFWNEQNEILATFIHHEMLEEIEKSVRSINVILQNYDEYDEEKVNLKVECKKAQCLLEHFKDSEMPTITNIL